MILNFILQLGLLIGTYGNNVYSTTYDQSTMEFGTMTPAPGLDCSYICRSNDGKAFFSVSENKHPGAYSFDGKLAQTAYIDEAVGEYPCYITAFPGSNYVLTANYGSGTVTVLDTKDNVITGCAQTIKFTGSGPVTKNDSQIHARAHQCKPIPASMGGRGKWLLVNDLGSDKIRVCKYRKHAKVPFKEISRFTADAPKGSGPRHMEFNEEKGLLYIITELSGEVLVYKLRGPRLKLIQIVQADEVGAGASADIHIHPSGKWLYVSHRIANDGISIFKIGDDGLLEKVQYHHTGIHPRNFAVSPDGNTLLVACMESKCVQVYPIDNTTGAVGPVAKTLELEDRPVCLLFL